ncbi:TRAP transporter substrate-binding protein [Acidovorax sp. SUPP2539]|nr:TRAP transporter substrate-binding protein [Acidovorax sp. SUPP2539]
MQHLFLTRALCRLALAWLCFASLAGHAQSPPAASAGGPGASAPAPTPAPFMLRVVGSLGALSQYTQREAPFWTQELARLSNGRFSSTIVPFDRAGVPGMEMLRLVELGVVPFGTVLMSSLTAQYPQYTAPDLPGLSPDIASLRTTVAAFRPYLQASLRQERNMEMLAIYVYPAQVIFCKNAMTGLADLSGRRIRVASASQADFISAVGGIPVHTGFGQMVASLKAGDSECAVTGTMSGNTMGLYEVTQYVYPMPLTWGLSIFGANRDVWNSLPPDLRTLLQREVPRLEAAIWADAERETTEGLACNTGRPTCVKGAKGAMVVVPVSAADDARRVEILRTTVLANWQRRCGPACVDLWNRTVGPARGITAPRAP